MGKKKTDILVRRNRFDEVNEADEVRGGLRAQNRAMINAIMLLVMCLFTLSAQAENVAFNKLKTLTHKITQITDLIGRDKKTRLAEEAALKKLELQNAKLYAKRQATLTKRRRLQGKIKKLKREQVSDKTKLNRQYKVFSQQIKAVYLLGNQPTVKLLLNQENPHEFRRTLVYYRYITNSRLKIIADIRTTIDDIQRNTETLQASADQLQQMGDQLKHEQAGLTTLQRSR